MNEETTWAESLRLELAVDKALEDAKCQLQHLRGKDKEALQMEWIEFSCLPWHDLDVLWTPHFQEWGK